jgi:Molecular chaperone
MPFPSSNVPSIGIDFGTTNSSIALATPDGAVELVSFPTATASIESFRSILYLEQHKHAGRTQIKSYTGPSGIEHYLDAEHKGRLIQSLKSYLTSRTLTGTEVFGRRYSIEDLISRILTDLRLRAEQQFGQPIRHATVGRPVPLRRCRLS